MKYKRLAIFVVLVLTAIIACAPESSVLVTIGDTKYTIADFKERFQFVPQEDSLKRTDKINEFVNQMCVVEEAKALGYEQDPVVMAALETHRKDIIVAGYYEAEVVNKIKIPDSDIMKQYEKLIDQYQLAQIVVASESLAQYLAAEFKKGMSFDILLKFSLDTISPGGDIGTYSALQLPPEIFEAIKNTKVGEVSDLITFGDYFYFLKILDHKKAETPKFNDVKDRIKANLMQEKARERGEQFVQDLNTQAKIEYNQEGLDVLAKPDSLITPEDLQKWVVKKYDTSYVYVGTVLKSVQNQYQRSFIDPKTLIDRVLIADLIYDRALQSRFDRSSVVQTKMQNALLTLLYQKLYSDQVTGKVQVDSMTAVDYYRAHKKEKYADKKLSEVFYSIRTELRNGLTDAARNELYNSLRAKYSPVLNESTVALLLKEEK